MRIKVEKEKCSGCHLCEMVCSLFHSGVLNVEKAAIRVEKDDLNTSINTPVVCRQCRKMKCIAQEGADEAAEKNRFVWDESRVKACPFKSLPVLKGTAYHCDLCGGDPQCTKVCTPGAITVAR